MRNSCAKKIPRVCFQIGAIRSLFDYDIPGFEKSIGNDSAVQLSKFREDAKNE